MHTDSVATTLSSTVLLPGDDGYDAARTPVPGGIDSHPAFVARPADAKQVAEVIALARDRGLELAVRSGGHTKYATTEGGVLLDLAALRDIEIDPEGRTGWFGTGLTAGEVSAALAEHGLVVPFGDTLSVGIGGITLGGGIGFLVRQYGMTIDSLLAAEVVTADGRVLHTDADEHPDLFWALRGGGGNFGVVTRLRFALHPLGEIYGGMLALPVTPEVIAGFVAAAKAAPDSLSAIANLMPAPPMPFLPEEAHGQLVLLASIAFVGDPEEGEAAVAPFRALATPLADLMGRMPYSGLYPPEDAGAEEYHPTAVGHTMFADDVDLKTAEAIVRHLNASSAPMRVTQLRVLGGAMAAVPPDATAFGHRASKMFVVMAAFFDGEEELADRKRWLEAYAADFPATEGVYVNFLDAGEQHRVREAYTAEGWERLRAIKATYDPTNLFHHNCNIPPAS